MSGIAAAGRATPVGGTPDTTGGATGLRPQTLSRRVSHEARMAYLLSLPAGYDGAGGRRWPLILFLHGAGERGDELQKIKKHGIPRVVEEGRVPDLPFITVSPQCPSGSWWSLQLDTLRALLDDVTEAYAVDPERVYLTGLSMGGFGTFALAAAEPDRFAAIAPVCGGGDRLSPLTRRYAHIPAWVFHGAADPVVPLTRSAEMVEALALCGADVRFTVYPRARHDSWTETYDNPELYAWLLSHSRRSPLPPPDPPRDPRASG